MGEPASPPNDFAVRSLDGFAVVTTPEEIDVANAARFRAALLTASGYGLSSIIVDMTRTEFCDSTGLNVLIRGLRHSGQTVGEVRLAVGGTALQRILGITGVGTMFAIYHSLDAALRAEPRDAA
jgi:anti-sigma B factor antagonist